MEKKPVKNEVMGNLLENKAILKELADHIIKREGIYNYFYCDNKGYVTIGIGTLVDASHSLSNFLKLNPNLVFKDKVTGSVAKQAEIIGDWIQKSHKQPGSTVLLRN
jgi:hypothetical protein